MHIHKTESISGYFPTVRMNRNGHKYRGVRRRITQSVLYNISLKALTNMSLLLLCHLEFKHQTINVGECASTTDNAVQP